MNTYKEHLEYFRNNTRHDCLVIHGDIKRLMADTTQMVDYGTTDNNRNKYIEETVKLKKLRYYFGEIIECLELADELFENLRKSTQPEENTTSEDPSDNSPFIRSITDQIQDAMAGLGVGDHAIIVVRKDSSEEEG